MSLTKILAGALSLTIAIIMALVGAWAKDTSTRQTSIESRLLIVEQHYASIDARLQDLATNLGDLKDLLKDREQRK